MKAQSESEKNRIKFLYAVALYLALKDSSINSLRNLAAVAGMEYSHIQRIARGKVNVSISVHVAILDALQISFSVFGKYYDEITEAEIQEFKNFIKQQQKLKGRK